MQEDAPPPSIHVWSYLEEYAQDREVLLAAVDRVFRSGQLILGDSGRSFEAEFAAYCQAGFGVGVDNGTNAIMLALKALGVQPGDEVVTVSNTAAPTVLAIAAAGARARFVDIEPDTYLLDPRQLEAAITGRTRCLLPVHLFGHCADMAAVQAVADRHHLPVLEDCAQAHGAEQGGRRAGSLGDAAAFSFYPTKILGGYGDGGAVLTNREKIAAKLRRLRYYGMEKTYYVLEPGYNSRLDEVQAEILRTKLPRLETYVAQRRTLAARYQEQLADTSLTLPVERPGNRHAYYLYVVRHPRRDEIMARLREQGIHLNISYPWPNHVMPGFADLGYPEGSLPHTEAAAKEIFSLPMYPTLTFEAQDRVCAALRKLV